MKLRSKFILIIIGLTILIFTIGQYLNYRILKRHIAETTRKEASNISMFFESLDQYLDTTFTENDLPVNEETFPFISAKAITEIATLFSQKTGGLTFRHASADPRNPENMADADEEKIINLFTENIENKEYFEEFNHHEKDYFLYAKPYIIEKKCLKCHGMKEDAPEYIRNNYEKSYGYKVGDLRGIASVKIPKDTINEIARSNIKGSILIGLSQVVAICLILPFAFWRFVNRPVKRITNGIKEIGNGNMDFRIGKVSRDELGQISDAFNVMAEDITRSNEYIKIEKERLSVTLQSIGDGVITTDNTGIVIMLNAVAESLTGWTQKQAKGIPLQDVFHIINEKTRERCENPSEKVMETGEIVGLANHTILISKNGNERIIADSGAPIRDKNGNIIGVVIVFRDITEKQKRADEALRSQKLDSIGILAGGIAHDFNNMLAVITGNLSLAMIYAHDNDKIHSRLIEVDKASRRAMELVQQLLTFSQGGAPIKNTASVKELIKESADFAIKGSNVKCEYHIPEDIWLIDADEGQISQVINNLIINADQAMPEGGIIKVSAENVTVPAETILSLNSGKYVKISVRDNGIGINKDQLQKIFDPYYTTKQKGSGLGLASCYSIIQKHDGNITVESELEKGTTFYLYLVASEEKNMPSAIEEGDVCMIGKGKILVMDDDESIKNTVGEMLTYLGYNFVFASHGEEAIKGLERNNLGF